MSIIFALLALLGIGGAAYAIGASEAFEPDFEQPGNDGTLEDVGKSPETGGGQKQTKAERAARRKHLYELGEFIEGFSGWDGYADFIDVFGLTESAWSYVPNGEDPFADGKKNKAIGPYQLRPGSASWSQPEWMKRLLGGKINGTYVPGSRPDLLQNPEVAAAAIYSYLARTVKPGATWGDVRASGAFPVFINGRPTKLIEGLAKRTKYKTLAQQQKRYDESIERFERDLKRTGRNPANWVNKPAYSPLTTKKMEPILNALGISSAALKGSG